MNARLSGRHGAPRRLFAPQRGSISQPRVASPRATLGVRAQGLRNPEGVVASTRISSGVFIEGFNPFRVDQPSSPLPRVARASQPWAEGLNPFRIFAFAALVLCLGCEPRRTADLSRTSLHSSLFSHVEIIGSRGTGAGQFNKPRSLTCDTNDNLYVVDMTGRVQKFSPDGKFLLSWQMPQTDLGKPKGMACDREGNIVVLEPHYQRVNHFTPEGKLVAQWGVKGTNAGELTLPRAIAVDKKNNVIASEYSLVDRVQKFSARGGRVQATWGTPGQGTGEFNRAEGVGTDSADQIYVADSCNHRIQVYSSEGRFLRAYGHAGTSAGQMSYPYDIALDGQGRQYVCEFGNSRIQVFDAKDQPVEIVGKAGHEPGQFANPWSVALDSKGNLYVADSMNHRVQKLVSRQSSKPQAPSFRETPSSKHQGACLDNDSPFAIHRRSPLAALMFAVWSFSGSWILDLGSFLRA